MKPVVLTLAMLLPVTSSMVWCERRPEIPEYSERSMVAAFLWVGENWLGSVPDAVTPGDRVERDVDSADRDVRDGARDRRRRWRSR